MKITVLGSGTSAPHADRGPAGYLLQCEDHAWWIDGGSGALRRTMQAGQDPRELTGGFYSHRHPDHCADLVPLLFAMRVGPPSRARDYPIWAGEGFSAYLASLEATYGRWIQPDQGRILVHELSLQGPDGASSGPLQVSSAPASHGAGALHLRFEAQGRALVYSGDTAWSENLCELALGADLLICECAGTDEHPVAGHLCPSEVAEIARQAQPKQIWLTHLYDETEGPRAVATVAATGVPTRHARDLDSLTL